MAKSGYSETDSVGSNLVRSGSASSLVLGLDPRKQSLLEDRIFGRVNSSTENIRRDISNGISKSPSKFGQRGQMSNSPVPGQSGSDSSSIEGSAVQTLPKQGYSDAAVSAGGKRQAAKQSGARGSDSKRSRSEATSGYHQLSLNAAGFSPSKSPGLDSGGNVSIRSLSRATQTDATSPHRSAISSSTNERILQEEIEDLKRQNIAERKSAEKRRITLDKCLQMNKRLLIEKSELEKRTCRQKSMSNRLTLGNWNMIRIHGPHPEIREQWVDGYAIIDVKTRINSLLTRKEMVERERKDIAKAIRARLNAAAVESAMSSGSNSNLSFPDLTLEDLQEQDELLKLRISGIKKEEAELNKDLDKLNKETAVHMRELKRIGNEDQSRFQDHPTLKDRYLILSMIGKGGFSEVHKAFDIREQVYVAIKIHHCRPEWPEQKRESYAKHALREYGIHKNLQHSRIVPLLDVFKLEDDDNTFATVMEFCEGNDLDFYLKLNGAIPEKEAKSALVQIVQALKYLNQQKPPIIHYDLKPGNILLTNDQITGDVKLTDFGLSKLYSDDVRHDDGMDLTSQGAGTYWYLPPECFAGQRITSKVDVWSLGILFYQMLYNKKCYGDGQTQNEILRDEIIRKCGAPEFPSRPTVSNEAKNFIRRCLTKDKDQRPNVFDMAADEYLRPSRQTSRSASSMSSQQTAAAQAVGLPPVPQFDQP